MGGIQKSYSLKVISVGERIAITNTKKAEMLAELFVKVHSSNNVSEEMKKQSTKKARLYRHDKKIILIILEILDFHYLN